MCTLNQSTERSVLIRCHLYTILNVCVLGGTLSGDSLCHHDVLLGWNSALHHVPGDDQQDNRQVGQDNSSHINLIYLALHHKVSASNYYTEIYSNLPD